MSGFLESISAPWVRCRAMSSFAKTVVALVVFLAVLVVALLLEGFTHNAIAAWVAVGALFAVLLARWLLFVR
jgi:uncharacterized membrane protein